MTDSTDSTDSPTGTDYRTVHPPRFARLRRPYCWWDGHEYSRDERIERYTHLWYHETNEYDYCYRCERCGYVDWRSE